MGINLLNLIDFEEVNKLLEGFNQSTGFVTAILDLKGNVLSKSGWRQICTQFHRVHPETARNCRISDTVLANELNKDEKYHFYKCHNGLVDVAVPIVINGEHIANLFSGQFFFDEPDLEFFKSQAKTHGFDELKYLEALKNVPVVSKEKVKIAMDFLLNMTQLISLITFQKMEQLQLNEALKASEERSRKALDQMLEGCQVIGYDWRYIYLNQTAEIHNRRPNAELLGNRYMDMWPGIEETEIFKIIEKALRNRVFKHFENEFVFPDGSPGWFDLSIQPVPEGVFILSIDVTERKKAEIALRTSEEKYRLVSDNSDDWIYWVRPDGFIHYVSPACQRVTGYSPEEFISHPELIQQIVFEADQELFRNHAHIQEYDDTPHQLDFRIRTKEGEQRWISHSCNPMLGINGEYLGRRATNRNITARKQQEEQLFESEFRFNKLYENGPFGMVIADLGFQFKKANPRFCEIMGYSESELRDFTFRDVTHPDDLKKDLISIQKLINNEISVYKTEKRYIRKDGQVIWGSLTVNTTYDSEGKFLYYLGIIEDITRRKLAEEELKKSKELLSETEIVGRVGGWEFNMDTMQQTWTDEVYRIHEVDFDYNPNVDNGISFYSAKSKPLIEEAVKRIIETGEPFNLDLEIVTARGNHRNVHTIGKADMQHRRVYGFFQDITSRKQAEEKIRELNDRIATATRSAQVGIWDWDVKNNLISWDDQMYALYGLKKDDFTGAYDAWLSGLHPDDREFARNETQKALTGEKEYDTEFRVVWPDGTVRNCKAKGEVFRDENSNPVRMVGVNYDITEQKKKDEKIREKDLEFKKLSANVPDLIFQFTRRPDGSYYVPVASEGIRNIFGCAPEDVIDDFTPISRVIFPEDAARVIHDIEHSAENMSYFTCEFRVHIPGREIQWIYSKSTPERLPDGSITWYGFNTDITEIKKLNETLEQRVIERTSQLESANKELEAFSYSVSHDLRAPLRHINGYVELINDRFRDNLPEKAQHYLATVKDASRQMGNLIDDLLHFSRTGRQELRKVKVNMNALVKELIDKSKPDITDRLINWSVQDLPDAFGDYSLLKQVWVNLIDNAVKYTRKTEQAEISVESVEEKGFDIYIVRDNGVGFDMKYSHKLFGVFQRLHTQAEFEGTGIGLANVQRIIFKHNGRVWVEAELNKGATFYFSLPKNQEE
ncbi:MAG: PAS domain-containing protein [Bacteroidales bacterium]|nr:PAS domain-containing protein [Bacteroidales bacterium]